MPGHHGQAQAQRKARSWTFTAWKRHWSLDQRDGSLVLKWSSFNYWYCIKAGVGTHCKCKKVGLGWTSQEVHDKGAWHAAILRRNLARGASWSTLKLARNILYYRIPIHASNLDKFGKWRSKCIVSIHGMEAMCLDKQWHTQTNYSIRLDTVTLSGFFLWAQSSDS